MPSPSGNTYSSSSFVLLDTDPQEVSSILSNLDNSSSTGWDNISTKFLKSNRQSLVPILTHIYNICFSKGVFPNAFKLAIVHPIFKSGNKDEISNYRPISVLTTLSKILEKLLNSRLKNYLNEKNILSDFQFGFRNGRSTEDAVLALTDKIVKHLDRKEKCIGAFLDLSKAFDTVSIPIQTGTDRYSR